MPHPSLEWGESQRSVRRQAGGGYLSDRSLLFFSSEFIIQDHAIRRIECAFDEEGVEVDDDHRSVVETRATSPLCRREGRNIVRAKLVTRSARTRNNPRALCLLLLRNAEGAGGFRGDAKGPQKRVYFMQFARIMRGQHNLVLGQAPGHATAAFCAATSSDTPASARSSMVPISSRENVAPSADICTSIRRPLPVITKLPSTPASLSSG